MSLTPAEQKVRKLARLPSNSECANCGTTKKFGFSTVCIKFHTFVCNNCKSSHQAISHRCKSLTMSSWSDAEAAELQRKGNDYCRRTWLKNAPAIGEGGRPKEGDPVDVFKRFVVDAYERKRYYGEDDGAPAASPASTAPQVATAIPLGRPHVPAVPAPRQQFRAPVAAPAPPPAPKPAPAPPVADLLDFSSAPAAATTPAPAPSTSNNNSFTDDFDAFAPKAPAPPAPAVAAAPAASDPFQPNFDSAPSAPAANSGFSFMQQPTAAAPVATPAPAPAPVVVKKPIMSSNTGSDNKSSFISAMNMPSLQQQKQQSFSSQGFGMNGMNNNNMMQQQQQMMMQQQQMMMMQRNMGMMNMGSMNNGMSNNGMNMNNMGGMGGMNNNMNMNGGMGFGGGGMNPMMNQQRMMNGGFGMSGNNNSGSSQNAANSMNSLDMNMSSMSDWTSGKK